MLTLIKEYSIDCWNEMWSMRAQCRKTRPDEVLEIRQENGVIKLYRDS